MSAPETDTSDRNAGLLLMACAAVALALANSPLAGLYHGALRQPLGLMTVEHWIADGLMALFFLLVGLEVKREWLVGRLADAPARRLPLLAAAAGMAVPAIVYLLIAGGDPALVRGWAIPAATDIAFALGVLALLGSRAPPALKLLLVTIAIIDDIGAVLIIALFYSASIAWQGLAIAAAGLLLLYALNRAGVRSLLPTLLLAPIVWIGVHESGVHATVAGVLVALTVPLGSDENSPLRRLEHRLHEPVMLGIVPLFGLASAGVGLAALDAPQLSLAVALGLILGKPVGVLGAMWLAKRSGFAPLPAGLTMRHLAGAALLCGIGFTMSLFIGALAFPAAELNNAAKLGTLAGSALAGIAGFLILRTAAPVVGSARDREDAQAIFGDDQDSDD
jgi:NhaA family Na+:H+ antiporter